jgi:DNA invertase Pin-like site-specific DNA recombinase
VLPKRLPVSVAYESRRKFDIVMAWSVDRLGRSLQDLIGFLSELHSLGMTLDHFLHVDVDTAIGAGVSVCHSRDLGP